MAQCTGDQRAEGGSAERAVEPDIGLRCAGSDGCRLPGTLTRDGVAAAVDSRRNTVCGRFEQRIVVAKYNPKASKGERAVRALFPDSEQSSDAWSCQRDVLLDGFRSHIYGFTPGGAALKSVDAVEEPTATLGGAALRSQWRAHVTSRRGRLSFIILLYTPAVPAQHR